MPKRLFRPTPNYEENRFFRFLGYIGYICAGSFAYFFTSRALETIDEPWMKYVWASFFLLGGLLSLVGVTFKNWYGELVGLPLMSGSSLFYAGLVFLAYTGFHDGAYLIVGSLIAGEGFLLIDRWMRLQRLQRFAVGRPIEEERA